LYPREYIQFLAHFHGDRDYFECHEILEEYWKKTDSKNKMSVWVGLILLAVSTYHHRRSNFNGAKRTLEKALMIFEKQSDWLTKLGLEPQLFRDILKKRLSKIEKEENYISFDIPICDPNLLEMCVKHCEQAGFHWGKHSDISNLHLIHRHKLRDRTSVIEERQHSLESRKGNG
jgi:predicted metal-dependent hydrolase